MQATPASSTSTDIGETDAEAFAGVDWSWQHHAVCVVDQRGERVEEITVPHSRSGLSKITSVLRRAGASRVGIERVTDRWLNTCYGTVSRSSSSRLGR